MAASAAGRRRRRLPACERCLYCGELFHRRSTAILPENLSIAIDTDALLEEVILTGVRILIILLVAFVALKLVNRMLNPLVRVAIREQMEGEPDVEINKRTDTLSHVLYHSILGLVVILTTITILAQLGINAAALIAGVGLVGLAVGFGAQNLVKDMINGMFILIENQYGKNDVVTVAGIIGLVEDINLRRTVLRDLDGTVHFIPHNQIDTASNWTKSYSRVNLNVAVAYSSDLDHVIEVINRVGQELAQDEAFAHVIKDPPHVLRVDRFAESGIEIKIIGETLPIEQWAVMGALRLRLKKAFDAEGIVIPFPQRTLHMATALALTRDGVEAPGVTAARE